MKKVKLKIESVFLLLFGVFHFVLPFIFSFNPTLFLFSFQVSSLAFLGSIALASLSVIFVFTRNRYFGFLLSVLYGFGIAFHTLYLFGLYPSVILVPNIIILYFGVLLDTIAIIMIFDYQRGKH